MPLAPLPDEIEVVDGDDDDDVAPLEAATQDLPDTTAVPTPSEPTPAPVPTNAPSPAADAPSPTAHTLSFQLDQSAEDEAHDDALDASLKPLDSVMDSVGDVSGDGAGLADIDISALGPDGVAFEGAHDLTQVEAEDVLLGGPLMDSTMDPFAGQELVGMPDPSAE